MTQRIRVLHIVADSSPVEEMATSLVTLADRRRFQPAVVSLGGNRSMIEAAGIPVIRFDKKPGVDLSLFRRLRQVFADFQPHLVHTQGEALGYTWPVSSLSGQVMQVHTIQSDARDEALLSQWLRKYAFRGSVTPVAVTPAVAARVQRAYGSQMPAVIANGVPVRNFTFHPDTWEKWRIANDFARTDFLIACIAPLAQRSGHTMLLDAFSKIASTGAKLLLAGDGPCEAEIRDQAKSLGLSKQVVFLGSNVDLLGLLAATDMMACISVGPESSTAAMKAMAAGRPCVLVGSAEMDELVEDNRSGLLVKAGDVESLSEALARLVDSPHLRARLGYAARERAVSRFDHQIMVSAYEALYSKLLAAKQLVA